MAIKIAPKAEGGRFLTVVGEGGATLEVRAPVFVLDGRRVEAELLSVSEEARCELAQGVTETRYRGALRDAPEVSLTIIVRHREGSDYGRYSFLLSAEAPCRLGAGPGAQPEYVSLCLAPDARVTAVRLSEFEESVHSYHLTEVAVRPEAFVNDLDEMGPILAVESGGSTALIAYEHGSTAPDAFIAYRFGVVADERLVRLQAVKSNVLDGHDISRTPFESVWFEIGLVRGGLDACAAAYRSFVLRDLSPNAASRSPYIFYNTWNYQERNKWWNGKAFLDSMQQQRMVQEIEVAGRMGIDVFVLDTGWYAKTGEWAVNTGRFDERLATVRRMLEERGMKLGLWFSPTESAVSAAITQAHLDCRCESGGKKWDGHPVWETEDSYHMCLVSRWWEAFADELIRLHREVGVTYFKWDAVGQYGCDSPLHYHGSADHSEEERRDRAAFEQVRYMQRIVDKVCAACPEAIVDFDVTESGRSVGLAFLASGKFFLINNGPYYPNLDDPEYAPGGGMGTNVFVFPGPARPRNCRETLDYDRWIPSVLFLAHYLPDDPAPSQETNIASLVLGHNGIWGDLPAVSEQGVALFSTWLGRYKEVRDAITAAHPIVTGVIGGTPEIHEKIDTRDGRGVVALFAPRAGRYTYVTHHEVAATSAAMEGVEVLRLPSGQARITANFDNWGGKAVFFGVRSIAS
jgi:alpha-galactosidase